MLLNLQIAFGASREHVGYLAGLFGVEHQIELAGFAGAERADFEFQRRARGVLYVWRHVFEQHDAGRVAAARVAEFDLHVLLLADHHFARRGHADRQLRHRAMGFYRGLGRVGDRGHAADVAFGFRHDLHFDRAVFAGRKFAELPHEPAAFGCGRGRRADKLRALRNFVLDGHIVGRLGARVAHLQHELGRLADLNFARGELLDDERRLLRAFESFFARLAGAIAGKWLDRCSGRCR